MKKLILLFSAFLLSYSSIAQSKVGTLDSDYVLSQMPEMDQVNQGLESYGSELQEDLESSITQYEALIETYQEKEVSSTEEEKETLKDEIISLEDQIKGYRQKASVMMQMRRNELTEPLYNKINEAMLAVIQEEGYTQILHTGSNALAFSIEGTDITEKVLNELGIQTQE